MGFRVYRAYRVYGVYRVQGLGFRMTEEDSRRVAFLVIGLRYAGIDGYKMVRASQKASLKAVDKGFLGFLGVLILQDELRAFPFMIKRGIRG